MMSIQTNLNDNLLFTLLLLWVFLDKAKMGNLTDIYEIIGLDMSMNSSGFLCNWSSKYINTIDWFRNLINVSHLDKRFRITTCYIALFLIISFIIYRFLSKTKEQFCFSFHRKNILIYQMTYKASKQIVSTTHLTMISKLITSILIFIFGIKTQFHEPKPYFERQPSVHQLYLSDIIWCNGFGCESESIDQGRSYYQMNISISDCFFSRSLAISGNGGVIFVDGGSYSMSVNYSMFYNCVCSNYGGAIYFSSTNSNLRMICANRCSCAATSICHGNFAYISASQMNQVEYLSSSYCSHTTSGYCPIQIDSGNQRVDNSNFSQNKVIYHSSIVLSGSSISKMTQSSFVNNTSSDCYCIWSGSISVIQYINLIYNNSPSRYGVVTAWFGSAQYLFCIFYHNSNCLFFVSYGSISVHHSYIYHLGSFGTASTSNNSMILTETYSHSFFSTYYCQTYSQPSESPQPTQGMTEFSTPHLTPYRSYGEQSAHQTLFPEQTPHPTLFPEQTPHQTLFPIHTPYHTHHPERTNHRTFPVDFNDRTQSLTSEQSLNSVNEDKSNSIFMYSTICMFLIIIVMISYNIGSRKNRNINEISSSSSIEIEKNKKREDNSKKENNREDINTRNHNNHHRGNFVSSPYVF